MGAVVQLLGVLLVVTGAWALWSPWALVIAGVSMLVVPEVLEAVRRR